jgi:NodT family efflux transporter outer membrane factor (OMF) lipoprotein
MKPRTISISLTFLMAALLAGCSVGPRYVRPDVPAPPEFKEIPPNWKTAEPGDQALRGNWWEIFNDAQLNALEEKINISNQNVKVAQAQFDQARALVRFNRAGYYPAVTAGVSAARTHESTNRPFSSALTNGTGTDLVMPVDASYEADVWGRVRRTVEASREEAQASAADLATVSLSLHAELAMDYLQLRELDAEESLLNDSVSTFQQALDLTSNRFHGGIASEVDVAQAQTQLETTRAQAIDVQVQRSQFEHAIAVLAGQPPSTFSLPARPLTDTPPAVPPGLPSQLLERRPDIAAAERRAAAANANIGVAKAAYFPLLTLSSTGGFESALASNWFSGPSGFVAAGAGALITVFDAGRRHAVSDQAWAGYQQSVASYRQTVLSAFQDVEDNLAAVRVLENESRTEAVAVAAAQHSVNLSLNRYRGGVATYLEVTTAQGIALTDERTEVQIQGRRMISTVLLVKALGGGWDVRDLPGK